MDWSYRNYTRWPTKYPSCGGKKQSPINIDTSKISECNGLCSMSIRYNPTTCNAINTNQTPIINIDPGSFLKFKGVIYELTKMTIHTPSAHTVNGANYDLEVMLYHCLNRSTCSDTGGIITSLLFQATDVDSGDINKFFNQFINELPVEETSRELAIQVDDSWGPEILYPPLKSFFWYEGSQPMPPCSENWTIAVFEDVQPISRNILETLRLAFDNNSRPVRPLNGRVLYYNSNTKFDDADNYEMEKIDNQIKKLTELKSELTSGGGNTSNSGISPVTTATVITNLNPWYVANKTKIKVVLILLVLVLVLTCAVKLTRYIVRSGYLINLMEDAIESKKMANENRAIAESILAQQQQGYNNQGQQSSNNQGQSIVPPSDMSNMSQTQQTKPLQR